MAILVLIGFIAGSFIATYHMPFWWDMPSLGAVMLADRLGWFTAISLQLLVFAILYIASWLIEQRPRRNPFSQPERPAFSWLHGPWPLLVGAVGLAILNALTLMLAGHPWSITWAFSLWGAKSLQTIGYDVSHITFWTGAFQQHALSRSVLADSVSVMDFGIILGAFLAAGLARAFIPNMRIAPRRILPALVAGVMLGYGARIAFGCNIGAYFSGIASTSLHGWLWLAGAFIGTPIGLKLQRSINRPG